MGSVQTANCNLRSKQTHRQLALSISNPQGRHQRWRLRLLSSLESSSTLCSLSLHNTEPEPTDGSSARIGRVSSQQGGGERVQAARLYLRCSQIAPTATLPTRWWQLPQGRFTHRTVQLRVDRLLREGCKSGKRPSEVSGRASQEESEQGEKPTWPSMDTVAPGCAVH